MAHWVASLLNALDRADSAHEAFDAVADGARQLGFEWCAYGFEHPLPFTRSDCYLISNYAPSWQARYAEARYLRVDPTVLRARKSMEPMVWNDRALRDAAQFWDEARSFGLRHGWAQSCFGPSGSVGLLSLARGHEPISRAELMMKDPELRWMVNVAHAALSRYMVRPAHPTVHGLTRREVEMMQWAADGKSARQTAQILEVSRFTVEFHLKNACRKLGAGSRAAATARAAAMGLLR